MYSTSSMYFWGLLVKHLSGQFAWRGVSVVTKEETYDIRCWCFSKSNGCLRPSGKQILV